MEGEINLRQDTAPVFNHILDARPGKNDHQLPAETPGHDKAVAVLLQVAKLPGGLPVGEALLFVFFPLRVDEAHPGPEVLHQGGGEPVKGGHLQAVGDGDGDQCRVLSAG